MAAAEAKVKEALATVWVNRNAKALQYAANYASIGLGMKGEDLRYQCFYVLANMPHWRGAIAREVRNILREYVTSNK